MPRELLPRLGHPSELSPERLWALTDRLCRKDGYERATEELREALKPDDDGVKILSVMLSAALKSGEKYVKKGISRKVYVDTMSCFSRFVREHYRSFGYYGFDRWFWTGRQLSLTLFRLGELEYEMVREAGRSEISVHIPSGAKLNSNELDASFRAAEAFFAEHGGDWHDARFTCTSWLLSPSLISLLPPTSHILRFAKRFGIEAFYPDDENYKIWIYGRADLEPEEFGCDTSLQRAVKEFVLGGGKIGEARGVLKADNLY